MDAKEKRYYETAPSDGIRFIYFDVGNVLFRYSGSVAGLAAMLGVPTETMKAFWLQHDPALCRGSIKPQEFWSIAKNKFQYKGPDIDFVDFWVNHFTPIPETHKFLRELSLNYRIGLLTNSYAGNVLRAKHLGHIPDIPYAVVIESSTYQTIKPEPKIFTIAVEMTGIQPGNILLIDDTEPNIQTATAVGMNAYHFDPQNPQESVDEISQRLAT